MKTYQRFKEPNLIFIKKNEDSKAREERQENIQQPTGC